MISLSDISLGEIKSSLFDIGDDKAPGPDGFIAHFFKKSWGILAENLNGAVLNFFNSGSLLKQINHAVIALVPKSKHAYVCLIIGRSLAAIFYIR